MSNQFIGAEGVSYDSNQLSAEKLSEDQATNKAAENSTTCCYQATIADLRRKVTVKWCKNLINHSLSITTENPSEENHCTCKIDLNAWLFWGKKGLKSFEVDGQRVDVFWDFRQAKFCSTPEPRSDYYVAVVSNQEVVLLLGDLKTDAYKRTKSRPALQDATLLSKKENVYGKRLFCAKTMLNDGKAEHDIVIETSLSGPGDPEMWISIDGTLVFRIMNLLWRFRGNETVIVNDAPVQIFWDVHDWLFNSSGSSHGLFIFKPGTLEFASDSNQDGRNEGGSCHNSTTQENQSTKEFFHFVYAWKTE